MVKIFVDNDVEYLEENINEWEEEQSGKIIIHDRLQSQDSGSENHWPRLIVISIWYSNK